MTSLLSLLDLERARSPGAPDHACVTAIAARVIDELGIREPPVDVDMVASWLDISSVTEDWDLDVSGCLIPAQAGAHVLVRARDPRGRRRFTVCHECGHTFFPGYALQPQFRCAPTSTRGARDPIEGLCDIAASELLLPTKLFEPAGRQAGLSLPAIDELAEMFDASKLATAHRLINVQQRPAAVLTFATRQAPREAGTDAEPKLRLQSAALVHNWPFFRRHKSVDPNDVFDRASQGEIVNETNVTIQGICAAPIQCDVQARPYSYRHGTERRTGVMAVLSRRA